MRKHRLPEIGDFVRRELVDVDEAGMALCPPANEARSSKPARSIEIATPPRNDGSVETRFSRRVQGACPESSSRASPLRSRICDRREPERARTGKCAARFRRTAGLCSRGIWSNARAVADDAGEHVDAAGRGFRIGGAANILGRASAFGSSRGRRNRSPAPRHREIDSCKASRWSHRRRRRPPGRKLARIRQARGQAEDRGSRAAPARRKGSGATMAPAAAKASI